MGGWVGGAGLAWALGAGGAVRACGICHANLGWQQESLAPAQMLGAPGAPLPPSTHPPASARLGPRTLQVQAIDGRLKACRNPLLDPSSEAAKKAAAAKAKARAEKQQRKVGRRAAGGSCAMKQGALFSLWHNRAQLEPWVLPWGCRIMTCALCCVRLAFCRQSGCGSRRRRKRRPWALRPSSSRLLRPGRSRRAAVSSRLPSGPGHQSPPRRVQS